MAHELSIHPRLGTSHTRSRAGVVPMAFAALTLVACSDPAIELGAQCDLSSDCSAPLVCRLERCRNACSEDRDCPLGAHCARDKDGARDKEGAPDNDGDESGSFGACLLPDEDDCQSDRECPSVLLCSQDNVCRFPCSDNGGCLDSQSCDQGFCVDRSASQADAGTDVAPIPADCNGDDADGQETNLASDPMHCGACDNECPPGANASAVCDASRCALACNDGFNDCTEDPGCETPTGRDEANCGRCDNACESTQSCIDGSCVNHPFPIARGATEPFEPDADLSIDPGRAEFTGLHIPSGVTVTMGVGTGILDIRVAGEVLIEGTLDLSGGNGNDNGLLNSSPQGGATGTPLDGSVSRRCNADPAPGGSGGPGESGMGAPFGCALGGSFGGGMGGFNIYGGGGGGGYAGGGGGGSAGTPEMPGTRGGNGGSSQGDSGGEGGARCEGGRGGQSPAPYGGGDGVGECDEFFCGGGGGGSIGASAAADLAVERTFRPGSAGGGGGATDPDNGGNVGGGGGGGGGGAVRLSSATRIRITGSILASGGHGGGGQTRVAGGGGGSGGVIYLAAPELEITATANLNVDGGRGGDGAAVGERRGGPGGLGRIRISTDPSACILEGNFGNIAPPATCEPTNASAAGEVYIGRYPN